MAWIIFPVNLFTAMIRSLPRVVPENTEQVIAVFLPLYELANSIAPFAKRLFVFFQRVLPLTSMVILFLCWLCQAWVNSIAVYLRGHKEEPLMKLSAFSAVYVAATTFFCARYLAEDWLFAGFFSSYLWGIPLIYRIYAKFKARHGVIK